MVCPNISQKAGTTLNLALAQGGQASVTGALLEVVCTLTCRVPNIL